MVRSSCPLSGPRCRSAARPVPVPGRAARLGHATGHVGGFGPLPGACVSARAASGSAARRRSAPCASMPSARAQDGRAYGATRNPRAPLEARTTTMPSSATKAIEYGAALRSSGDSEPGSLMAVAAMARF